MSYKKIRGLIGQATYADWLCFVYTHLHLSTLGFSLLKFSDFVTSVMFGLNRFLAMLVALLTA